MICRSGLCCISDYYFWNLVTCIFICKIMMIMNVQDSKNFVEKFESCNPTFLYVVRYLWCSVDFIHQNQSCDLYNKFIDKMIYYISIHITYLLIYLLWKKNRGFNLCVRVWEVVNQIAIMCCMIRSEKYLLWSLKTKILGNLKIRPEI